MYSQHVNINFPKNSAALQKKEGCGEEWGFSTGMKEIRSPHCSKTHFTISFSLKIPFSVLRQPCDQAQ